MIILKIIIAILLLELFIQIIIRTTKKNFQWFVNEKDEYPRFDELKFKNFIANSFHKKFGWVRKSDTFGYEKVGLNKKVKFTIDKKGYRKLAYKHKKNLIATFGDSYVFSRQVKDKETWQTQIGKKIKCNVLNYGVGNYGIDQSFLRYKNTSLEQSIKIIILGFVPETICRIQSEWKHYLEFGNVHGFKPKFFLKKNKLRLKKNSINISTKISELPKIIDKIKKTDRFYKEKFIQNKFTFPYLYSFLRNFPFNLKIIILILLRKIFTYYNKNINYFFYNKLFSMIMIKNIKMSHTYYKEKYSRNLLKKIIEEFKKSAKLRKHIPVIVVFPQLIDLKLNNSRKEYESFYKEVSKSIHTIDLTTFFLKQKLGNFFTNDKYGGHMSKLGNKKISKIIFNELKKNYPKILHKV